MTNWSRPRVRESFFVKNNFIYIWQVLTFLMELSETLTTSVARVTHIHKNFCPDVVISPNQKYVLSSCFTVHKICFLSSAYQTLGVDKRTLSFHLVDFSFKCNLFLATLFLVKSINKQWKNILRLWISTIWVLSAHSTLSLMKPIYMKYNHQYRKTNIISTNKEFSISTCKIPIRFQTYDCDKPTVIEVAYLCN